MGKAQIPLYRSLIKNPDSLYSLSQTEEKHHNLMKDDEYFHDSKVFSLMVCGSANMQQTQFLPSPTGDEPLGGTHNTATVQRKDKS